ncbi:MAG: alanine--glyoxylate aminotransferase family protein [Clostridia bacterium]|nr:alanine--glyoxylate aminotransferase family protein [Clostridia bacterium]
MWEKQILLLPGPTQIPPRVMRAMSREQINHRGPVARKILFEIIEGIKEIMRTENDILIFTSSGTGGMEAAVANIMSPGDKALVVSNGAFGDRFKKLCQAFNIEMDVIDYPWGEVVDPQNIEDHLKNDHGHKIKAVFVQHNETSTGVLNDMEAISKARGEHPALLVVDAISSLAAAELQVDKWGLDVVISGSQKAFMIPPGLSVVSISPRAWEAVKRCTNSRFYFDFTLAGEYLELGQTPFTPALSLLYGLQESLKMMRDEGLENILKRHSQYRNIVRAAVNALGLEMLAREEISSPAVTAVKAPEGMNAGDIINGMLEDYNVVIAGGQGNLRGKIFRIGHLGYMDPLELVAGISALESVLSSLGQPVDMGKGVTAAMKIIKGGKSCESIDN